MRYLTTALFTLGTLAAAAQTGHEIKVTLKPFRNEYVYLGHYNGKQLPIIDSVRLDDKSQAVFKGTKPLGGGIYLIGFPDKAHNFEFIIDKNQRFAISADTSNMKNIQFTGSQENLDFQKYQQTMTVLGTQISELMDKRAGSSKEDSLALTRKIEAVNGQVKAYRNNLMEKQPSSLIAALLRAMKEPEVPTNNPAARTDSQFAYKYFKKHYWDGVSFTDDRLSRTPFFEGRVEKYYDQLVYPAADSVIKEIDWMMSYANVSDDMQKFMLLHFINRYFNQKFMWEDAVFVHLFEKYFASKDYPWLTEKGKKMIQDRAYSLMANLFGKPAPDIDLPDTTGKNKTLYNLNSDYVLVAIWDPTCSHCKETLPKLDSAYHASWKAKGLSIFSLAKETDGTRQDWLSFIRDHHLDHWSNVYYSKKADQERVGAGTPGYSQLYDVQSFPTLYLLDKDKRIIAKKVSFEQVDQILDYRLKKQ